MQLIAYGGKDLYNYKLFSLNQRVYLYEYLDFIEKSIFSEVELRVRIEKWRKDKIHTILLLRKKFEIETRTKWKQFSTIVLQYLEFPSKPNNLKDIEEFGFTRNYRHKSKYTELSQFFFKHFQHIHAKDVRDCLYQEPVLTRDYVEDFIRYVQLYYRTQGKCYKYPLELISVESWNAPGKKVWIKQNIQHQKILQTIKKEKRLSKVRHR